MTNATPTSCKIMRSPLEPIRTHSSIIQFEQTWLLKKNQKKNKKKMYTLIFVHRIIIFMTYYK